MKTKESRTQEGYIRRKHARLAPCDRDLLLNLPSANIWWVVGKPFEITQTEDSVEQAKECVKRALAGETIVGEFSRLTGEGDVEYHSFNIQPVKRNNEIVAIEGFINDITERKKAEEALRNSEERWRSLAECSPDHIMLLDLKFSILYINRTVPDLKREEVIGTSTFNYIPPEWHRVAKDCFKRVIATGKTDHHDTEYRSARLSCRPS